MICYDDVCKNSSRAKVRHTYYIAIQMGVFVHALEKLVCFCPMRSLLIPKVMFTTAFQYRGYAQHKEK